MVSIIIPIYNTEKLFLEKCIKSILEQSYEAFEILLIDDGSKKEYIRYLDEFSNIDSRIKTFHSKNRGVSYARNKGLKLAKGEFVVFVDADDWIEKSFLEQAVEYIENEQLDLVIGSVCKQYKNKKEIKGIITEKKILIYEGNHIQSIVKQIISCSSDQNSPELKNCMMGAVWCKMYRKRLLDGYEFNEKIQLAEDSLFNVEILGKAKKIGLTTDVWYNYRINNDSALKRYRDNYLEEIEQTLSAYKILVGKQKIPLWNEYYIRVMKEFSTMMYQYILHPKSKMNFRQKYGYIKKILNRTIWKEAFKSCNIQKLDNKHKIQLILGKMNFSILILCLYYVSNKRQQKKLF